MIYYCLLGSVPELALAELRVVLHRLEEDDNVTPVAPHLVEVDLTHIKPQTLLSILGGTVKMYSRLPAAIADEVAGSTLPVFAISGLGTDNLTLTKQVKLQLADRGLHSRYRLLKNLYDSVGILKDTQEYLVVKQAGTEIILKTVAVQDIGLWTAKDYRRPAIAPRAGMLPPKVSRMLVNLALPEPIGPETLVYDPFCGVGTILVEALALGAGCVGSDISSTAVTASEANLAWFTGLHYPAGHFRLFSQNLLTPITQLEPGSIDAVVAEGYLGPPNLSIAKVPDYVKGLTKFYLGALKHLHPVLKPGGMLVICLPAFVVPDSVKTLKGLVDSCEKLGYTAIGEPLWYFRPQALVRRHILIWQKAQLDVK